MNKKGQMPKIKPILIIIVVLIVILGGIYLFTTINTAKKINNAIEKVMGF